MASAGAVDDIAAVDSGLKVEEDVGRRFYLNLPPDSHHRNANMEPIVVGPRWINNSPGWKCFLAPYLAVLRRMERKKRKSRHPFVDNTIRTARYTVWSFIPKQLGVQFSKVANVYFLMISILQAIPDLSPTGRFTTIFPLSIFVIFSMAREAYDDYFRHKHDAAENNGPVRRLKVNHSPGAKRRHTLTRHNNEHEMAIMESSSNISACWEEVHCKALQVGDIISVKDREFIPADLIVLATTNENGTCFIETSNLDGETNLKLRQALKSTNDAIGDIRSLAEFRVHAEPPSGDLYSFDGYIVEGKSRSPLTVNQLLQRGATLRNTKEIFGTVVYSGEESKIRKNSNTEPKTKAPHLEQLTNRIIIAIFFCLALLAAACTAAFIRWDLFENKKGERHWYLAFLTYASGDYIKTFFSYIVLYNAFIPISLYVTMEVIKLMQVVLINNDLAMYDEDRDIPAEAHTSSLNEELGQVQYLFTDKTGTLTENLMEFRMFSVAGRRCRHFSVPEYENSVSSDSIISDLVQARQSGTRLTPELQQTFDFLEAVALCQSVVADPQEPKKGQQGLSSVLRQNAEDLAIVYQASSADEVALLNAARDLFFTFKSRNPTTVTLNILNSKEDIAYGILDTIEFTSDRKRMSCIYRYPNGRIVLLCKGADNVILERLQPEHHVTSDQAAINRKTLEDVASYASIGLRTLLYSYRILDPEEYEIWAEKYADASSALQNRSQRMAEVAEEIERNLMLLGATAIEDRLQDGVPETIEKLRRGNIKVWMLTGDKTETAINIGHTCSIIRPDSTVFIVREEESGGGVASIERSLDNAIADFKALKMKNRKDNGAVDIYKETVNHAVIVIEGGTLTKLEKQHSKVLSDSATTLASKASLSGKVPGSVLSKFLDLSIAADSVICCRFSPSQKALMVTQVRNRLANAHHSKEGASKIQTDIEGLEGSFWDTMTLKPRPSGVTLAIGDGANDIPMIESAHVGIGITGREGLAASRAADYAIARFRFLQPLLFVHGRWSYVRNSLFTLGTFYKNVAFYGTQIVFQFWTGATGTSLYEQWTLAINNVLFTSLPVVVIGILEKDLNRSTLMAVPELYRYGQENQGFNFRVFTRWMIQGAIHAIIAVVIPAIYYGGLSNKISPTTKDVLTMKLPPDFSDSSNWMRFLLASDGSGEWQDNGLYAFGIIPYSISLVFCTVKILYMESHNWTIVHHLVTLAVPVTWFAYNFIYSYIWPYLGYENGYESLGLWWPTAHIQLRFWALIIVTSVIGVLFVDYWVNSMSWLTNLRMWGAKGGRMEAGRSVNPEKVKRNVEVERMANGSGPGVTVIPSSASSSNIAAATVERTRDFSIKALRYQMAREDAAHAASHAIGEHDWAKEVRWWQIWERRHKVTSDLSLD
ncbi:hypothetical protein HDU97_001129 [Phlyctochytrium planicorne]|nr:hypothetical protein HDU97_001129 [Phlyctochytrium planicorne]